jgi:hypothetical protein
MTSSDRWTTTVTELLGLFREALLALVPIAERAKISWRDGEAYDDWDAIAAALFNNLVVRGLRYGDATLMQSEFTQYDTVLPFYRSVAFISVDGPEIPKGVLAAFVGLAGGSGDFAHVKWTEVLETGESVGPPLRLASYATSTFSVIDLRDATPRKIDTIVIDL